jgi:hypothetical protein
VKADNLSCLLLVAKGRQPAAVSGSIRLRSGCRNRCLLGSKSVCAIHWRTHDQSSSGACGKRAMSVLRRVALKARNSLSRAETSSSQVSQAFLRYSAGRILRKKS